MIITDGTGSSVGVEVDDTNKLMARAIARTEVTEASSNGDSYIVTSGFVTLTNTSKSAILYYKNEEDRDVIITRFIGNARSSTGASVSHVLADIVSNPSGMVGGTTVTAPANNLNLGSSRTLLRSAEVGLQGATLTGGAPFSGFVLPLQNFSVESSSIIMPKGSSIGVTVTPPAGNTSFSFAIGLNVHLGPS